MAELTIGRDPESTVIFDSVADQMVSRRHAVIRINAGRDPRFQISDLGSRNHTFVNGRMISAQQEIQPGDTIQVGTGGPTFTFELRPPPGYQRRQSQPSPARRADGAGWSLDIDDLEAFAMAAAAGEASWDDHAIGGEDPERGSSQQQLIKSWTFAHVLVGTFALFALVAAGLYLFFALSGR